MFERLYPILPPSLRRSAQATGYPVRCRGSANIALGRSRCLSAIPGNRLATFGWSAHQHTHPAAVSARALQVMLCGGDVLESFNATKENGDRLWPDDELEVPLQACSNECWSASCSPLKQPFLSRSFLVSMAWWLLGGMIKI